MRRLLVSLILAIILVAALAGPVSAQASDRACWGQYISGQASSQGSEFGEYVSGNAQALGRGVGELVSSVASTCIFPEPPE